jgi:hypothetical protein
MVKSKYKWQRLSTDQKEAPDIGNFLCSEF